MKSVLLSAALLLALPTTSQAQAAAPARPLLRFFGGGSYAFRNAPYQVLFPAPRPVRPAKWLLMAGYFLTPRLSLQLSYSQASDHDGRQITSTGIPLPGDRRSLTRISEYQMWLLPLLARYSLIYRPNPRLQLDALLGATLLRSTGTENARESLNDTLVSSSTTALGATQGYVQAGLGLRYPFGRHLEAAFDWTYSRNLQASSRPDNRQTLGNDWGLTRTIGVGLRYRFGLFSKS